MSADATIEIERPPAFDVGQKVRTRDPVRNDGTYPGEPIGAVLVDVGEVGYVCGIGTFLQRYRIYAVDFFARGRVIGMRAHELQAADG